MKKTELGIFFSRYLWLGLILLLLTIILDKCFGQSYFAAYIIIKLVESIAIAAIITSILIYIIETDAFLDKIKNLFKDSVVHKCFFQKTEDKEKQGNLNELLKPGDLKEQTYDNISRYYDDCVKEALSIDRKNVRSDYAINSTAFFDAEKNKIGIHVVYSYRLYSNAGEYKQIVIGFDENDLDSFCEKIVIHRPDGNRKTEDQIKLIDAQIAGLINRIGKINLNEYGKGFEHLDIEIHTTEYGYPHWLMFTYKTLHPTDGFRLRLRCKEGLQIKKHSFFDIGNAYHIETRGKSELDINCNQWITKGVGVSILIAHADETDFVDLSK